MSIKSRTIDNLGIESSVRYAKDKEFVDLRLIEESKWLPKRLEIPVTKPYVPSEFEKLFSVSRTVQWALFDAPPEFEERSQALFSYQLIPSLGTFERQELAAEKLAAQEREEEENRERKQKKKKYWDDDGEEDDQRKVLIALFKCLQQLDKTLTFINARRNQYQRG